MASIEPAPSGIYHIRFRFGQARYKRSLRTKDVKKAQQRMARLEENIELVRSGRLRVPDDTDL